MILIYALAFVAFLILLIVLIVRRIEEKQNEHFEKRKN